MRKVSINHIYECYPLYCLMYGRELDFKAVESLNSVIAAENFWQHTKGMKGKLRVLELFAGRSEHKQLFLQMCKAPIEAYHCMDIQEANASEEVVIGDALQSDFKGYNFIIAHYYSLVACIFKQKDLQSLFTNIHRNLKTKSGKGAFYFNLGMDGYRNALLGVGAPIVDYQYFVSPCHPIRKMFRIDDWAPCYVQATTTRRYDRYTSINYDIVKKAYLVVEGKKLIEFVIAQPFENRFWSETEVVDAATNAGFTDLVFYHNGDFDGDLIRNKLTRYIDGTNVPMETGGYYEDGETVESFMATDMMVIT